MLHPAHFSWQQRAVIQEKNRHLFSFLNKLKHWLVYLVVYVCSVTQLCLTLCDPMDCSLPGFSVHEIFQAKILEWGATTSSRGSSWIRAQTCISCIERIVLYQSHLGSPIIHRCLFIKKFTYSKKHHKKDQGNELKRCARIIKKTINFLWLIVKKTNNQGDILWSYFKRIPYLVRYSRSYQTLTSSFASKFYM